MSDVAGQIAYLEERQERLAADEELCNHHWNGSDGCYETYCTGCETHTGEIRDKYEIPFKSDNFCFECQKTTEEKEQEQLEYEKSVRESELKTLALLVEKYPSEAKALKESK